MSDGNEWTWLTLPALPRQLGRDTSQRAQYGG